MKFQKVPDRRFASQLAALALLVVLPVTMIVVNGAQAVRALVMPPSPPTTVAAATEKIEAPPATRQPLTFGVYDPEHVFSSDGELKLRHRYVSWASFDANELAQELRSLEEKKFQVLLTIEPWPITSAKQPLMEGIVQGEYDSVIDQLADVIGRLQGPVYLSWGHEMDQDLTERYPWSNSDPQQFIAAYRYVVDRLRQKADTKLVLIWAGVLKRESLRYWPGDDYVDLIGMPIYSFPQWDQQTYGYIRDFRTTFEEKRAIVSDLKKPLIITELGVSGSPDFDAFWLHQAFQAFNDYPELTGVVFFFASDHEGAWGADFGTPDWRVHPDSIRGLVSWHLRPEK